MQMNLDVRYSMSETEKVFNASYNLKKYNGFEATRYVQRFSEFEMLVDADTGEHSFTPSYEIDYMEDFLDIVRRDLPTREGRAIACTILSEFRMHLTNEDIINNQVPEAILNTLDRILIEYREVGEYDSKEVPLTELRKGLKTPKLSRFLVRLFGEDSPIVSYYNSLPRKAGKIDNEKYIITVSVLPHRIAGMSYYASGNHGGEDWEGEHGTSCQDTERGGHSSLIFRLPPNLIDASLGIAWLSHIDTPDVYEARALVRLVKWEGRPFFMVCRRYGTDLDVRRILTEGLKTEYGDLLVLSDNIRGSNQISVMLPEEPYCEYRTINECENCDGSGEINEFVICEECDHLNEVPCPSCVDGCKECDDYGFVECGECNGHGGNYETTTCDICDGDGELDEYEASSSPYIDESEFVGRRGRFMTYEVNDYVFQKYSRVECVI